MPVNLALAKAFVELSLKGGSALLSNVNEIKGKLSASFLTLNNAFEPAQSAILGLVQAASPQAFNTFLGSMRLLAASIGNAFIPLVIDASKWIQKLAGYIREMDPETKKLITTWTGYAVAVVGAVAAMKALSLVWSASISILSALGTAIKWVTAAMALFQGVSSTMGAIETFSKLRSILDTIKAHAWATAMIAGAGAVLALIYKINAGIQSMQDSMNKTIETMTRMRKGVITEDEFKGSLAEQIDKEYQTDVVRKEAAEDELKRNKERMAELSKNAYAGKYNTPNSWADAQGEMEERMKQQAILEKYLQNLKEGKKMKFASKEEAETGKMSSSDGFKMAGNGMGGQVSDLSNAFMQTASAALQQDELQQKLLQEAMAGNQVAREAAADNKRAADALEAMSRK